MVKSGKTVKILLAFPVVAWTLWVMAAQFGVMNGTRVVLPVRGFDPRDILAGHYLAVGADYSGFESDCAAGNKSGEAHFCPDTRTVRFGRDAECAGFIRGWCKQGVFHDGAERFYIPEQSAVALDKAVRDEKLSPQIVLNVGKDGTARPADLILDGVSYREYMKRLER